MSDSILPPNEANEANEANQANQANQANESKVSNVPESSGNPEAYPPHEAPAAVFAPPPPPPPPVFAASVSYAPPAPPPAKKSRLWVWLLAGGAAFALFVLAVFTLVYLTLQEDGKHSASLSFGGKIAVVDLTGVILSPTQVSEQLKSYADDDSVKAIILHVNSPGGGVAASEELYRAVRRIRDEKKKLIVTSIESVGASGAYYVASGTNKIYADNGSIVGSIGVITEWINYGDLLKWAKLKSVIIKTGEFKDTGTPTRDLTPNEVAYMQGLIDNMKGQFIHAVADGRKLNEKTVADLATGRVWTGEQSKALGLIDGISDFDGVVKATAKEVGITGEPNIVRPSEKRRTLLDVVNGDLSNLLPAQAHQLLEERHPGFYYMWE